MSKKKPVMSHDPLSGLVDDVPELFKKSPDDHSGLRVACADRALATIVLPESMTIADVGELQSLMVAVLESESDVSVDGSGVELVDGAGLQLLVAMFMAADKQGVTISWVGPSETLVEGATQVGLASVLGLKAQSAA